MSIKEALKQYRKAVLEAKDEIEKIRAIYKDAEASRLEAGTRERLNAKKAALDELLNSEIKEGKRRAAEWATLDGTQITADVKLLDFDLTPAEFAELADRYKDNGTMSRMLYKYGEKRNAQRATESRGATTPFDADYFDLTLIPTKETKAAEFSNGAITAKGIADRMTIDRGYMSGVESEMVTEAFNNFVGETNV